MEAPDKELGVNGEWLDEREFDRGLAGVWGLKDLVGEGDREWEREE